MDDACIRASGLNKAYVTGDSVTPVLQEVGLEVTRGECLFLVGPSGSGKTTLLSILGCILSPDSGALTICDTEVSAFSSTEQARFRREKLGFVFQKFHLFAALSALENVQIAYALIGTNKLESRRQSLELLDRVGLAHKAGSQVRHLSMGQRQRVALARALAGNPEVILADEPTASLDAEAGMNAMHVLKELCRSLNKTVVVVTHDSRIFPMADRILRLSNGRIAPEPVPETPYSTSAA
ncbi:MAG: ABC transporter ATP-binding protein [Planctomycetes bacterium]|nr:ABC transporter ATP-binding protein [Planctomycetota bacterium]